MKIDVTFIDNNGFWHKETGKSKNLILKWVKCLHKDTEIRWQDKASLFVSQQYVK